MASQRVDSFWGPVTSTTDWCEKNYAVSAYIVEFFNTISNIPCIILAFIGLINSLRQRFEKRFSVLHLSNMALAIGSMIFHATLQHAQQQSDETPMVWEMLLYIYVLYSPDWHYTYTMPTFLFLYGAAFATFHSLFRFDLGFKIHYIILALLCLPRMYKYYIHTTEPAAKRLAHLYILTLILGGMCWLLDRTFVTQSLLGTSILRATLYGIFLWVSMPILQMHFCSFAGPNNANGVQKFVMSWVYLM